MFLARRHRLYRPSDAASLSYSEHSRYLRSSSAHAEPSARQVSRRADLPATAARIDAADIARMARMAPASAPDIEVRETATVGVRSSQRSAADSKRGVFGSAMAKRPGSRASDKKIEQGGYPAPGIVSTLFPRKLDLLLIGGVAPLVRARAPPETWTTRLRPRGRPEPAVVDHLFRVVINFSIDCPRFGQSVRLWIWRLGNSWQWLELG